MITIWYMNITFLTLLISPFSLALSKFSTFFLHRCTQPEDGLT